MPTHVASLMLHDAGEPGIAWVRSALTSAGRLGRLLDALPLESGRTWAWVPEGSPLGARAHPQRPGVGGEPGAARAATARWLADRLAQSRPEWRHVLLADRTGSGGGHPALTGLGTQVMVVGLDAYACCVDGATPDAVHTLIGGPGESVLLALTAAPRMMLGGQGDRAPERVTPTVLHALVAGTVALAVDAWGGESLLVWEPDGRR